VILASAEEEDMRGVNAWFLHAPAEADHAGGPTMMIDAIRLSCGYRPSQPAGRRTTHPGADLPPRPGGTAAAEAIGTCLAAELDRCAPPS
jgi:hypothetical protein